MRGEPLRCPNDGTRLVELERADVLIDACPTCRGVWLDRGELDKILVKERELASSDPDEDFFREMGGGTRNPPRDLRRDVRHDREPRHEKKRRRKSLLEELLDFD